MALSLVRKKTSSNSEKDRARGQKGVEISSVRVQPPYMLSQFSCSLYKANVGFEPKHNFPTWEVFAFA